MISYIANISFLSTAIFQFEQTNKKNIAPPTLSVWNVYLVKAIE